MSLRLPFTLVCLGLFLCGCDRKEQSSSAPTTPATTAPVRAGTATVQGVVTLSGNAPEMATIPNQPCHAGAGPLKEETVVVDSSGHLQNVIVFLEDTPPAPAESNLPPVVLDQKDCRYVPHVVALRTGQTLRATTSDPTLHNVHGLCAVNEPFNFALVAPGQSKDLTFSQPELFPVRCDVHPWMRAYVQVFPHPYFAVTDGSGRFEIGKVPPGSYTLVAWQEKYGSIRQPVTVEDGKKITANFTFQSGL